MLHTIRTAAVAVLIAAGMVFGVGSATAAPWPPLPGPGCSHDRTMELREDLNDQQYWVEETCIDCGSRVHCRPEDK